MNDLPPDHVLTAGEQLKLPNQAYLDAGRDAKNTTLALEYYMQTHAGRLPPNVAHPPSLEDQILGPAQWHHVEANGYDFGIDAAARTRQVTGVLDSNPDQTRSRVEQRAAVDRIAYRATMAGITSRGVSMARPRRSIISRRTAIQPRRV